MTRPERHSRSRRRSVGTMLVLAAGGAAVGAVVASRRGAREPLHAPAEPRQRESGVTTGPEVEQHQAAPTVERAERRPSRRRRKVAVAYGTAALLLLSGVGLIGVAAASQKDLPQPPPPVTAASPAPETAPARVTAPSRGSFDDVVAANGATTAPEQEPTPEPPAPLTLPPSRPVTLDIPSIDVRSDVRDLGLTDEGELETPSGAHYNDAAWYRHSPTPGSLGPSILLGHVDSAADGPSVFFRLGELRAGDRVSVTRADGSVAEFTVDEVRRFAKKDFPTDLVYGDIDHAGLRILTCGGEFDEVAGSYLDNIVVFASLVDD